MIHTVDPMRQGEVDADKFRKEVMKSLDATTLVVNGNTDNDKNKEDPNRGSNGNIPSIHVTQVGE